MVGKLILIKLTFIISIAALSPLANADIRSATGKPLLDFYTVYGAVDSVRIINELCNTKFPEYKKRNDAAYSLWRTRNKDFIYKIEQYNHAIVTKTSKENDVSCILLLYKVRRDYGSVFEKAHCQEGAEIGVSGKMFGYDY